MPVLIDATTAEHTRGIGTVIEGILGGLPPAATDDTIVAVGPSFEPLPGLRLRNVGIARNRPGRLLYQRLLLPIDIERLRTGQTGIDRVLLLDSYVPMLRPQRQVRYAALVHDLLPITHPQFWPLPKRLVKQTALRSLRSARASLFTSTEYNARQIGVRLGIRARVVQFGCGQLRDEEADLALTSPLAERSPFLVYVGALEPRKDVLLLVEAFEDVERLLQRGLGLAIVGDGPTGYRLSLERRIARSAFRERIRIVDRASKETTVRLISQASALVFPSLAEGFGLPILEALALGTPVVARSIHEISSWAQDSITYAATGESWAESIAVAVESSNSKRRAGQEFARNYRWRTCAEQLLRF